MHRTTRAVGGTAWLVIPMFLCATVLSFGQNKTERERKPTEQVSPAPNAATQNIPAPAKKEDPVFKGLKYRPIGPYRGGRSLTASGIPGDPNTYYFGSTGGGVWKSTDGAMTWTSLFDKKQSGALAAWRSRRRSRTSFMSAPGKLASVATFRTATEFTRLSTVARRGKTSACGILGPSEN